MNHDCGFANSWCFAKNCGKLGSAINWVIESLEWSGVGVTGIEWEGGDGKEEETEAQSHRRNPEKIWGREVKKC